MRVTLLLYRWEFNWLVAESGSMALRAAPEDMYQSAIHPLFLFKPHFLMAPTSTLFKSAIMEIRRALSHGWVSPFVADLDPYLQCCISARASLRLRGRAASLKRCHWYKQLLVTAGSSYLPWRFFWLDVSNTTLFSAVYSNLDSLWFDIQPLVPLNLSGALCFSIWRARHIIYCPRMPSLRRSLIWMLRSVSHDVTWWHDPIYHNQRLKIRLSFRWLNILCRNTFFSCIKYDKKYVNSQKECSTASNSTRRLSTAWHEDYLLLPSHAFRTSRLFWQLISLLRMFCWVSATFSWAA